MNVEGFKVETIPIIYYKNTSLERAIDHLFVEVDRAHREGANIIILSDRGVDENHVAIPSLLAVAALQQYLVQTKKRTSMAVILESGEPRVSIILQLFLDMVLLQLTHILHRRVFRSLSTLICLTRIIMQQLMITIRQLSQVLLRLLPRWVFQQSSHIRC